MFSEDIERQQWHETVVKLIYLKIFYILDTLVG